MKTKKDSDDDDDGESVNLDTDEEDDKRKKNKKEKYVKDGLDVNTFIRWKELYKNEAFVKDMEK